MRADGGDVRVARLVPADAALYRALYTDDAVMRHLGGALTAAAADAAFAVVCRQTAAPDPHAWYWRIHPAGPGAGADGGADAVGLAAVVLDRPVAGRRATTAELGVLLAAPAQAGGLATATIVRVAAEVFSQTRVRRLWTRHAAGHAAAAGLMRTLGFDRDAAAGEAWRWSLSHAAWMADPTLAGAGRRGAR